MTMFKNTLREAFKYITMAVFAAAFVAGVIALRFAIFAPGLV